MAWPSTNPRLRVEDLYAMPDDGQTYELQEGLLVSEPMPGFRHGRVAARIVALLSDHVLRHELGTVLVKTGFILARDPDTARGPDVSFVSRQRLARLEHPARAFPGAPDLAVEVLSPSNTPAGIHAKIADYLAAGTRLVWIVDPEREMVSVYRTLLAPRLLSRDDELDGEDVIPAFRVRVSTLFEI